MTPGQPRVDPKNAKIFLREIAGPHEIKCSCGQVYGVPSYGAFQCGRCKLILIIAAKDHGGNLLSPEVWHSDSDVEKLSDYSAKASKVIKKTIKKGGAASLISCHCGRTYDWDVGEYVCPECGVVHQVVKPPV